MAKSIKFIAAGLLTLAIILGNTVQVLALEAATSVKLISSNSQDVVGDQSSGDYRTAISADGRYVAFESYSTNLVANDTNNDEDVFLKDTQTGLTTRISTDSSGSEANNGSNTPAISADGRYVAFYSSATNLVTGDTNGDGDIFLKDTQTGVTTRISTDSSGAQANDWSDGPTISSDGRYVAFESNATNLVIGDTNTDSDIFRKDTQTGSIIRVSTDSSGNEAAAGGTGYNTRPSISADGRYVAFSSPATNLVANDTNNVLDVFHKDTQTGVTTRVSTDSSGAQTSSGSSGNSSISANGRYVSFYSTGPNLVTGDTNAQSDVFLKDIQTGAVIRASTDSSGAQATGGASYGYNLSLSANGRYVAFYSGATNLVDDDTNGEDDIFLKDTQTGTTARVSTDSSGAQITGSYPDIPSISADGRYVSFSSFNPSLVPDDTNGDYDLFLRANPLATILEDVDFSDTTLAAGASTDSVLANATVNGQPADPAEYVLSITDEGGLTGVTINSDGTLTIPVDAVSGTYTVTYEACETAAPTYCWTATAVLGVSVTVSELAETGTRQVIPAIAGLALIAFAGKVIRTRRLFRNHYRSR